MKNRNLYTSLGLGHTDKLLKTSQHVAQVQEHDTSSEELATNSVGSHKASDSGPRENAHKFDGNIRKTGGWKTTPFIFGEIPLLQLLKRVRKVPDKFHRQENKSYLDS